MGPKYSATRFSCVNWSRWQWIDNRKVISTEDLSLRCQGWGWEHINAVTPYAWRHATIRAFKSHSICHLLSTWSNGRSTLYSTMSLWVDRVRSLFAASRVTMLTCFQFRPKTLDDLHYHQGLSVRLKSLVCWPWTFFGLFIIAWNAGYVSWLPAYALLWTFWSREEDTNQLHFERAVWKWCRESEKSPIILSWTSLMDEYDSSKLTNECSFRLRNAS